MPADPKRVESLFALARVIPSPADRAAFLVAEAQGDDELRERVERLLAALAELEADSLASGDSPTGSSFGNDQLSANESPHDGLGGPVKAGRSTEAFSPTTQSMPRERGQVEIVVRAGAGAGDLYRVLLRRLRVGLSILTVFYVIIDVISKNPSIGSFSYLLRDGLLALLTALIWVRPPATVRWLRRIELLVLGSFVFNLTTKITDPGRWEKLDQVQQLPETYWSVVENSFSNFDSGNWFMMIVIYGTLIPNTWRRSAVVCGVLALCPIVLLAAMGFRFHPIDPRIVRDQLFDLARFNGLAVAVVAFTSSRIEILRRQVAAARRMGQYVLREQLGGGGMGEVYRAEHVLLRRPCAIKLIRPERAGDPKNLARFEREVQVTATLTHPNTIQIYDYGRTDDGTFYYVMEYLPGENLEQLVKRSGPLPPDKAVHILRQVCGALREAHASGLIHRDIKPSNIIVCSRGGVPDVVKLLDFGIVDVPDEGANVAVTGPGQILGTPMYMSAEQASGFLDLDLRSDLYSLGATAYFMLTGRPPFDRATVNLTIAAHIGEVVSPPHIVRTDVPKDLSGVVVRCLEKDPARRCQNADELDHELASCACAGGWAEERAVQSTPPQPDSRERSLLSTSELKRRWGI